MRYGFGIDVGGTTIKLAFLDENGTMKDKIGGSSMELDFSGVKTAAAPVNTNSTALASAALQELGYSAAEVAQALKGVDPNATTEEMVRYGLRQMVMKG